MIRSCQLYALQLFDVAESIDLAKLTTLLGVRVQPARLEPKPAIPSYVQYQVPPLQIDGGALGIEDLDGFRVRFKFFDYGVVSLLLARPFSGTWPELAETAYGFTSSATLERRAEVLCRRVIDRVGPALHEPRDRFLAEDYFVFAITQLDEPLSSDALLQRHGADIAQILRAERELLSAQERDEVIRHRLSYLENDLVVPTWSSALVYDTEAGLQAALEIFEYANSQLLQFRYYDNLVDGRLARIYDDIENAERWRRWWPRKLTHAAHEVQALFIDVTELTDRTENALKLVGDLYTSRLLALVHARLGVTEWRASVQDKLKTLDEIYRFAVEQTGMDRGEVLEVAIVALIVFEIVLAFIGR